MSVTLRLRDVSPSFAIRLREAVESTLEGDWCVTVSQSHLDGQWYLQLEGAGTRTRAPLPSPNARVQDIEAILERLSADRGHHRPMGEGPPPHQSPGL